MLGKGRDRLGGDVRARRGAVDDEQKLLARPARHLDGHADRAQIVRARPRRNDDQVGYGDHLLDRGSERRRRVDDGERRSAIAQRRRIGDDVLELQRGKRQRIVVAGTPPLSERTLRIGVGQNHRALAQRIGLNSEMRGNRRLAGAALLRRNRDDARRRRHPYNLRDP